MTSKDIWDANGYHKNSAVQFNAALHLLKNIKLKGSERILDVGCGDGKITAQLAQSVPRGLVLGIDKSPEMINFSQSMFLKSNYSNLCFQLTEIQEMNSYNAFDIIFSSFSLQWIMNLDDFLDHVYKALTFNGFFIATVPLGIPQALEQSLQETLNRPRWCTYFIDFVKTWDFREKDEYSKLIRFHKFHIKILELVFQKEFFSSKKSLENYLRYSFPHSAHLPEELRASFLSDVIHRFLEIEPPLESGMISFSFPRLDIMASKPIL